MKRYITALAAIIILGSCTAPDPVKDLAEDVFELAKVQYAAMAPLLTRENIPVQQMQTAV